MENSIKHLSGDTDSQGREKPFFNIITAIEKQNIIQKLEGKKSYIFAVLVAIVAALQYLGVFSEEVAQTLYGLLGAGGLAALRAGISKTNKNYD